MTIKSNSRVELISQQTVHNGRIFDLVQQSLRLPSGLRQDLDLIAHPGAVAVAALGEDDRLLVVKQYRAAASDWVDEIPAGRLEVGEDPLDAARRELEEETGYRAEGWRLLCSFLTAPGFCSEVMHLYEATNMQPIQGGGLSCDEDEDLEAFWLTREEILRASPLDSKTMLAALMAGKDA